MRLFFSVPYGVLKYTKPLPVIYFIVSGLKIGLIVLLIHRFDIYGIIAASLGSALVEIILLRLQVRKLFYFKFNLFKMVLGPLILLALILLIEPVFGVRYPYPVHLFYVLSCGGLLWWAYRNELPLINPFRSGQR
jgi:O-antigen/teichoic acid export membrane protein